MMTVNKIIVFTFLLFYCSFSIQAQEGVKPLGGNSILQNYKQKNTHPAQKPVSGSVFLPFFDEFSYWGPYADPNKWDMSQSVFVNRGYPIAPPTIGAATFDGLTRFGYPYNIAATAGSFLSDTLLSVPIRLDYTDATLTVPITPADSVYLSFYYQAKGRGDKPEPNDALNLFFFAPGDTLDFNNGFLAWSHQGYSSFPVNDTNFHRVMVPLYRTIDDTIYFKDTAAIKTGFRFAFINWGTQCGAIDHWHIDQVYLNKGRSKYDTLFTDVSFVYDEQSLLKNYMQMPYNQFAGVSDMRDSMHKASLRNNKNTKLGNTWNGDVNISTEYQILNSTGSQVAFATLGTNNVYNYDSIGYCKDAALVKPSLGGFTYNTGPFIDTTSYLLKFYVKGNGNDTIHRNDTAYFHQSFQHHYAYDDGTAEAGYYAAFFNGEIAVKYKLNFADTLRAIDIFFDPVDYVNVLQNTGIGLVVWGDNSGHPGNVLLFDSSSVLSSTAYPYPVYSKNGYDVFQRYQLSQPVPLAAGTTFYVGTYQQTNVQLGIGLDYNTDTHTNNFYFDGTNWNAFSGAAMFAGSLMIHPVFGDSLQTLSVKNLSPEKENVGVYPNPATDEIFISSSDNLKKITITNLLGNILIEEQSVTQKINVSSLPNGLYLLRTFNTKGSSSTQKLIISR